MTGLPTGAADRAAAAVRALGRADQDTTAAAGLLAQAGHVDWTGPGAAAYRDRLEDLLDAVRLTRDRLRAAEGAAAEHAAALREEERAAAARWATTGTSVPGLLPGPRFARSHPALPAGAAGLRSDPVPGPHAWTVP